MQKELFTLERRTLKDEDNLSDEIKEKLYIQHFNGPIFFGFTFGFKEIIRNMPQVEMVVFRMHNVPHIDQSGMYAIEDAIMLLQQKGIKISICCINQQPRDMLEKIRVIPNLISHEDIYDNFDEMIEDFKI